MQFWFSSDDLIPISELAAIKLVPLSDLSCFAGPLIAKNLHSAFIQLCASKDSITSMCTPLVFMHVNRMAHLLLCAAPPRVRRVATVHSPNTSSPT